MNIQDKETTMASQNFKAILIQNTEKVSKLYRDSTGAVQLWNPYLLSEPNKIVEMFGFNGVDAHIVSVCVEISPEGQE